MTSGAHETSSAEETVRLGESLADQLGAGDVVLVRGDLGAGKTTFIKGVCRGLGVVDPVTSPTFTIGSTYSGGKVPVSHLDLYRIESVSTEDPALFDDYLGPDRVAFIEWPPEGEEQDLLGLERTPRSVTIEALADGRRRVVIE